MFATPMFSCAHREVSNSQMKCSHAKEVAGRNDKHHYVHCTLKVVFVCLKCASKHILMWTCVPEDL